MELKFFVYAVVCFMQCVSMVTSSSGKSNKITVKIDDIGTMGIKKSGTVLKKMGEVSLTTCTEFCQGTTGCAALNYDLELRTCEAMASVTGADIKSTKNLFVRNMNWTNGLDDKPNEGCAARPCTGKQKCVQLRNSEHACVANYCETPRSIYNAILRNYTSNQLGATIQYECQSYWKAENRYSSVMSCQLNGLWEPGEFACYCGTPPAKEKALISGTDYRVGRVIRYYCNGQLHNAVGIPTSTCLKSGQWTETDFKCVNAWTCYYGQHFLCIGTNLKARDANLTPGCVNCACCQRVQG